MFFFECEFFVGGKLLFVCVVCEICEMVYVVLCVFYLIVGVDILFVLSIFCVELFKGWNNNKD